MNTLIKKLFVFGLASWLIVGLQTHADQRLSPPAVDNPTDPHVAWLLQVLRQMETVTVGTSRADLLKVLVPDGGLSVSTQQSFHYPGCPYIHVDVTFKGASARGSDIDEHEIGGSGQDTVTKISRPYIARAVVD